ncbi:DNA-binding transcription factor SWI5 NDAI_0J00990 [Naumovozyma dairenensis CBS 421]|uniref:C2H2-type domain-containing protein n=1 Tax=Naumovozyma dairenensis (strain ATCC 10597 / BCRC 20456 / CBS 421 / NBRC 0211 / NRRL Y-12639) TaxID=1071378 RepID=G0WGR3_NAUDC|nr:hypothetical protein NDAI_0J00990 [Naumovozyma dairenensis CBS 421]CCD26991.1 hypothetical protein NDAI_0J00990 [Naumovozyma dairenensis CBS 421]
METNLNTNSSRWLEEFVGSINSNTMNFDSMEQTILNNDIINGNDENENDSEKDFDKMLDLDLNLDVFDGYMENQLRDLDIQSSPTCAPNNIQLGNNLDNNNNNNINNNTIDPMDFETSRWNNIKNYDNDPPVSPYKKLQDDSVYIMKRTINDSPTKFKLQRKFEDDNSISETLLKQQEELRYALEKQQELNMLLAQQLKKTQVKQEKLESRLEKQDTNIHPRMKMENIYQNKNAMIELYNKKNSNNKSSNNKIDQIPSPGYFTSPNSMVSPPMSTVSITGSPQRRQAKSNFGFNGNMKTDTKTPKMQLVSPALSIIENSPSYKRTNGNNNFFQSPANNLSATMDELMDDHNANNGLIGLGIQLGPKQKTYLVNENIANNNSHDDFDEADNYIKPSSVDILPTIPGSNENTPLRRRQTIQTQPSYLSQNIYESHTPIKPRQLSISNDKLFEDSAMTPQLRPPPNGRRSSYYETLNTELQQQEDNRYNETPSSERSTSPQHLHEFIQASSSSNSVSTSSSPIKITRKLTTLPRGSIDQYVKELPDKTFECLYPACEKKFFKRRYNIRSHIQTHLEDRPYVCDFFGCDKAFVRNHDLVRHKKVHCEKTFACPCGKKFNREDALIVHRSRMICSGGKKFDNVVIKRSPRKRGRPRKDGSQSVGGSPVKDSVARDTNGQIVFKMEKQIRKNKIKAHTGSEENIRGGELSSLNSNSDNSIPSFNT